MAAANEHEQAFQQAELVPNFIPAAPQHSLHVSFTSGSVVQQSNEIHARDVKEVQEVVPPEEVPAGMYTLIMADPDAPSKERAPAGKSYLHWLVTNIRLGSEQENADGDTVVSWVPSGPPRCTGLHRYAFLLYRQSTEKVDVTEVPERFGFDLNGFVEAHGLESKPVAGNFYLAQWDDSVRSGDRFCQKQN